MKKLVLCAFALMLATVGFAQFNDSDVLQVGMLNASDVNQIGWINDSDVFQLGILNDSEVDQMGIDAYDAVEWYLDFDLHCKNCW